MMRTRLRARCARRAASDARAAVDAPAGVPTWEGAAGGPPAASPAWDELAETAAALSKQRPAAEERKAAARESRAAAIENRMLDALTRWRQSPPGSRRRRSKNSGGVSAPAGMGRRSPSTSSRRACRPQRRHSSSSSSRLQSSARQLLASRPWPPAHCGSGHTGGGEAEAGRRGAQGGCSRVACGRRQDEISPTTPQSDDTGERPSSSADRCGSNGNACAPSRSWRRERPCRPQQR